MMTVMVVLGNAYGDGTREEGGGNVRTRAMGRMERRFFGSEEF